MKKTVTISGEQISLARALQFAQQLEKEQETDPTFFAADGTPRKPSYEESLLGYLRQVIARRLAGPRGEVVNQRVNAWSRDGRARDIEITVGRPAPKNSGMTWTGCQSRWIYERRDEIEDAVEAFSRYRAAQTIDTADITAALRAADIDYRMQHGGTLNESIVVTRPDGRTVAFAPSVSETGRAVEGIDVAYYVDGLDSEVRTQDYVLTVDVLVANLRRFLN